MPNNVYIGSRYVPIFDGTWDNTKSYEPLTIVEYGNNTYTSKRPVPVGTLPTNTTYWALTGNYNGQIAHLQDQIDDNTSDITALTNRVKGVYINVKDYGAVGDGTTDDTIAINSAISALNDLDVLFFPDGIYRVTSKIRIEDKFTTILGFGATLLADFAGDYVAELECNPTYDGTGTDLQNRTDLWQTFGFYGLTIDCNGKNVSGLRLSCYRGSADYVTVHNCIKTGIRSHGISYIRNCKINGLQYVGAEIGVKIDRADNVCTNIEVIDAKIAYQISGQTRAFNLNAWNRYSSVFNGSVFLDLPDDYMGAESNLVDCISDTYEIGVRIAKNNLGINLTNFVWICEDGTVAINNPTTYILYVPTGHSNAFIDVDINNSTIIGLNRTNETQFSNVDPTRINLGATNTIYNVSGIRNMLLPKCKTVTGITWNKNYGSFNGSVVEIVAEGVIDTTQLTPGTTFAVVELPFNYAAENPISGDFIVGDAYYWNPTVPNENYTPKYHSLIRCSGNNTQNLLVYVPATVTETQLRISIKICYAPAYVYLKYNNNFN